MPENHSIVNEGKMLWEYKGPEQLIHIFKKR